jgi:hypothetical protein
MQPPIELILRNGRLGEFDRVRYVGAGGSIADERSSIADERSADLQVGSKDVHEG